MSGSDEHQHDCDRDQERMPASVSEHAHCCGPAAQREAPAWREFVESGVCLAGLIAGLVLQAYGSDAGGSAAGSSHPVLPWSALIAWRSVAMSCRSASMTASASMAS